MILYIRVCISDVLLTYLLTYVCCFVAFLQVLVTGKCHNNIESGWN